MDVLVLRQRPLRERLAGASGAMLLQAGLLFLFLYSMPELRRPSDPAGEMMLVFRSTLPPPPRLPALQPEAPLSKPPPLAPSPLFALPPAVGAPPTFAVPDLRGFGDMLNNCLPQIYDLLPPEKQARCPHFGTGTAQDNSDIVIAPGSHAKDAALWQEDWDENHWTAGLCDTAMGLVALCQMHQAIAEYERAADVRYHLAKVRAEALKPPAAAIPYGARAP